MNRNESRGPYKMHAAHSETLTLFQRVAGSRLGILALGRNLLEREHQYRVFWVWKVVFLQRKWGRTK